MCRLYGFRANDATKVECTLVLAQNALLVQSQSDEVGVAHPDGWGIAFYDGGVPVVDRRDSAAFEDLTFSATAARLNASTVVAHVRKATVSGPSPENTHPFIHGRWTFAHNGTLTGFDELRDELRAEVPTPLRDARRGGTDSETIFYWVLAKLAKENVSLDAPEVDLSRMVDVLRASLVELIERSAVVSPDNPAKLNLLFTDGRIMMVSRWKRSLHYVVREAIHDCEICGIPHPSEHRRPNYRAVVVASEPISHEAWEEVPEGTVVAVDAEARVALHPF